MNRSRRDFVKNALSVGLLGAWTPSALAGWREKPAAPGKVRVLTSGPNHHFFGYYGVCPWNKSQTHLLSLETTFQDRLPTRQETAKIGLVDARTGAFNPLTTTSAWNLQQGAMLHWHPKYPDRDVLYNDFHEGRLVTVVLNVQTGRKRYLLYPLSGVDHQGNYALVIDYGRAGRLRKVVGYEGLTDPNPTDPHPANDGVFLMNLATGETKLIVSMDQVYRLLAERHPELANEHMWFNHTEFNKSGSRFFLLARTWEKGHLQTGMFTANTDGSALREVVPYGTRVSHFDWRNDREIITTCNLNGDGAKHILFTDGQADYKALGGPLLAFDGHCCFSPDEQWLATDRNHGETLSKSLWLYDVRKDEIRQLGNFPMYEKKYLNSDVRCDLHPRWNRSGTQLCIDALEPTGGTRQLHIVER